MKRTVTILLVGMALAIGMSRSVARAQPQPNSDSAMLAGWLSSLQYTQVGESSYGGVRVHDTPGATGVPDGKSYYRVSPYIGNLAVTGLLASKAPNRLKVAERWFGWFFAHLSSKSAPDGVPCEHFYLKDGSGETTCVDPNSPKLCNYNDATDSAAATLFRAIAAYLVAGGSPKGLEDAAHRQQVDSLARTMLALQQPDGLFWAKINYREKYLEDNCEVYDGLLALAQIEKALYHDGAAAVTYLEAARRTRQGIESQLYSKEGGRWLIAKSKDDSTTKADLKLWSPGMQCQVWPQLFGVVPLSDPRSKSAIRSLNEIWDGAGSANGAWWQHPEAVNGGFLNSDVAYAAALAGDRTRVEGYLAAVKQLKYASAEVNPKFPWPFAASDAGWLLRIMSLP